MVLRIADSADGIPLFLEEMTKYVVEQRAWASVPADRFGARSAVALPTTLQASLNSRLDLLGVGEKNRAGRSRHRPRILAACWRK